VPSLVDDPSSVTLVVTDQMPAVISKLDAKVPWQFGGQDAADTYTPYKADGARASAKTLQLADETAVVIDSAVVHFGKATTRRIVHHEAQHAWLRQAEDMAWAMQRRAAFTRPAGNIFAFVYLAQSMVDEYRCEATLTPEVSQADKLMTVSPDDGLTWLLSLLKLKTSTRSPATSPRRSGSYLGDSTGSVPSLATPPQRSLVANTPLSSGAKSGRWHLSVTPCSARHRPLSVSMG